MKKINVLGMLVLCFIIGIAAMEAPYDKPRNLKVLPKNISEKALDSIMDKFNADLGVQCNFCHKQDKKTLEFDYATDVKGEKGIARKMMIMTNEINKKYFNFNAADKNAVQAVTCFTCHRNQPTASF